MSLQDQIGTKEKLVEKKKCLEDEIRSLKAGGGDKRLVLERVQSLKTVKQLLGKNVDYSADTKKRARQEQQPSQAATEFQGTERNSSPASTQGEKCGYLFSPDATKPYPRAPREEVLTAQQIETFLERGFLVVDGIFCEEEIREARRGLHETLRQHGVDPANLHETGERLRDLSSTGGAGGIIDVFYTSWKMKLMQNEKLFALISQLWERTYAIGDNPGYVHPFGSFDPTQGYYYVDRVCFRVPDSLSRAITRQGETEGKKKALQRSLTPHLDCCPLKMFESDKAVPRWRPIQCFVSLTDNLEPNTGGFECVPGFHKEFESYFARHKDDIPLDFQSDRPTVCVGDFSPIRPREDAEVINRMEHIPVRSGSVVVWDYRLPHANSYENRGLEPREVVYTGFLPPVPLNRRYATEQLKRYLAGVVPSDHWQEGALVRERAQWESHQFNALGARLMALLPWDRDLKTADKDEPARLHES